MKQKIMHIFFDTDMRNQHDGLVALAKQRKVDITNLDPGQHAIFINRACDKLKMFSAGCVLSYLKTKRKMDLMAIEFIPGAFVGSDVSMAYTKALKKTLADRLGR